MGRSFQPSIERNTTTPQPGRPHEYQQRHPRPSPTMNLSDYFITRKDSMRKSKSKSKCKKFLEQPSGSSTPQPSNAPVPNPQTLFGMPSGDNSRRSSLSSVNSDFSLKSTHQNPWSSNTATNRPKEDDSMSLISLNETRPRMSDEESLFLETCSISSDFTTSSRIKSTNTTAKFCCPNPHSCYKYGPRLQSCSFCKSGPLEYSLYVRHLRRNKHKENRAKMERTYSEEQKIERDIRTIVFTGFLRDTSREGFAPHLYSFGMVDFIFIGMEEDSTGEPTLIVEMNTEEDAVDACKSSNLHFGGTRLQPQLKRRALQVATQEDLATAAVEQVLTVLKEARAEVPTVLNEPRTMPGDSVLLQVMHQLMMTPQEVKAKESIVQNLEKFLQKFYPNARCDVYGSSAIGLGMSGADLNIRVDVGQQHLSERSKGCHILLEGEFAKKVSQHLEGNFSVKKVTSSTTSRQPFVAFVDVRSHLHVKLVFGDNQTLLSTRLIKLYLDLHPVVKPYLFLVRLWAFGNGITDSKKPFTHLSSYALTTMALFVLMRKVGADGQPPKAVLPTVNRLVKDTHASTSEPPSDCGCCSLVSCHNSPVSCTLEPAQLIRHFLKFYSTFKYDSFVICPANGKMVPKYAFLKRFPKFKTNLIALQDPFILHSNLAVNLMQKPLLSFGNTCGLSLLALDDVLSSNGDLFNFFMPSHLTRHEVERQQAETELWISNLDEVEVFV